MSEEANPEESSATVEYSNGHSDINTLSVEPTGGIERIEESLVLPVIEQPSSLKVDEVGPDLQDVDTAVPSTITDELWTAESSNIDNLIRGQVEEAKDDAPDRLEIIPEIDIMATVPAQACAVDKTTAKEPLESAPTLLESSVEQPEILERIGSPVTVTEAGAGQSNVTTEAFEELKHSVEPPESE